MITAGHEIWEGPPELRAFLRPIDELQPHPDNPRRGDIALVRSSLERFGQEKPIVTDRDDHNVIVAGNHTFHAARSLGWTHIAALEMWEHAADGERYLLMDNRTSDRSSYDREELLDLLERHGGELEATGWSQEERELLRAEVEEDRRIRAEFEAGQRDETTPAPRPQEGTVVRNLLVKDLDTPTFQQFSTHLKVLQREWGIVGNSEVVAEAVRRELLRIREGDTP